MNNNGGRIDFETRLNTAKLRTDAQNATKIFGKMSAEVEAEGKRIDETFKNMGKAAAAYFTAQALWDFGKGVVNVRKEVESLEISFTTLLGSESKAKALFAEINEFAVKTPMQLNDLAKGAQTLLGFGIEAERVMTILKQLGDVSMGNREKFNSLTLAFAQATSAGKLQGQDLLQMINAGFNPLNEIAKKTGKSIGQLKDDMSKGKISAKDLAGALESATKQGGLFYGMLEKQSKGMEGALSNLEGAWADAQNRIGESMQGGIVKAVDLATVAVEHYEEFAKVVMSLAAAYGTYKAVLMATYVIQKAQMFAENIRLVMMFRKELGLLTATQQAFNITSMKNPYIILGAAIIGVITALILFTRKESEAQATIDKCNDKLKQQEKELERLKEKQDAVLESEKEAAKSIADEVSKIEVLTNTIHDETASLDDRNRAIKELQGIVPNYHAELDKEGKLHKENKDAIDKHIESLNRLAIAKALQSKREEIVAQKMNAELDRRAAKKEEQEKQKDVENRQNALDRANSTQQALKKSYDESLERSNRQPSRAGLPFLQHGRGIGSNTYKASTIAVGAAEQNLKASQMELQVIQGKIQIADATISSAEENLARLDEMMKEYKAYLPEDNSGFTPGSTNNNKTDEQQAADELLSMRRANQQAEIDLMKEGSEKKRAQIELNYQQEIDEVKKQKKAWEDEQNGVLTDEQRSALGTKAANAMKARETGLANIVKEETEEATRAMNEYLAEYGTYLEKREAIIALYDGRIKNAATQGEKDTLAAKMREDLSALDMEANKTTSAIAKLFDNMTGKTVKDMRTIAKMGEEAFQFLKSGEWDDAKGIELGISKETFETIRNSPEELAKLRKGIDDVTDAADKSDNAFNKMANGLKKVFKAGESQTKLQEGLELIEGAMNDILQVGGFLSDTLTGLSDAFGSGALGGIAEGINVAMDAASSAMSGAKVGAMFGPMGAAIGGAIGLVGSLAGSFAKLHDAKHEKRIQKIQDQIEVLEKNYEKLADSIEKAYSKDATKLIEQQNTLLEQQKILIQQQIKEEEDKKKTDRERIEEWKNEIEEIDKLIKDNKEAAIDAIFGEDINSAIENFSDALVEAWAAGEDKAESAKDVVKKMMRQMVTESIKAAIQSSGAMEQIRQKLQQFYADNVFSGWEQDYIYKMAEDLQKQIDSQFGWADSLMTDSSDEDSEREGVKKGIATASQESVDENNARLTTIQGHTFGIKADTAEMRKELQAAREMQREVRDLAYTAVEHLAEISKNTRELYETNRRLKSVEESLDDINTRGVTIRK